MAQHGISGWVIAGVRLELSGSNIFDFDGSISEEVAKSNGDPEQIKPSTLSRKSID